MKWYWKVRLYRQDGHYYFGEIVTECDLQQIDCIQDFYEQLTGCKMLLEGMQEKPYNITPIADAFTACWISR